MRVCHYAAFRYLQERPISVLIIPMGAASVESDFEVKHKEEKPS